MVNLMTDVGVSLNLSTVFAMVAEGRSGQHGPGPAGSSVHRRRDRRPGGRRRALAGVVTVVQFAEVATATDDEIVEVCSRSIARYDLPKVFIRTAKVVPPPAGQGRLPLDKLRCDGELQHLSAARLPSSRGCDGVATG